MEQKKPHFLRSVGIVLGATIFFSLIVVIIGLILHWNTPVQFSNGFFVAGGL